MKARKVMNRVVGATATSSVDCWFQLGTCTQLKMLLAGASLVPHTGWCLTKTVQVDSSCCCCVAEYTGYLVVMASCVDYCAVVAPTTA
jgi:hypothetical protein